MSEIGLSRSEKRYRFTSQIITLSLKLRKLEESIRQEAVSEPIRTYLRKSSPVFFERTGSSKPQKESLHLFLENTFREYARTCSICLIQAVTISSICSSVSLELAAAMKSLGELILVRSMLSHSLRLTASSRLACALARIPE